ncbi:inorganic phosphate transporter, PiT family [Paracoccus aminovorans]|uniref:Phosphate transporter n=1 Tax=Paracoccus aminovorans TaxID=34004 RepID=A0A1I2ZLT1_9RHOB|nr:inorganic phosphate transporter [Paracoccus aminovorans]CQR85095.1 phosphate permease [Paracoccus aminovorans]SFH38807.1 inorganic phosphate transporter, PiT family [Paracoccus aminovorans]
MTRRSREYRTLDKDLSRVANTERAVMQSGRPVFRLGIALLFMAAAAYAATGVFAGQPALGIVAAAMAVAAWLGLSIGANDVSNSLSPAVGAGAIGMTSGLLLVAVMEVLGAVIAGAPVTVTLTQGLVGGTLGQGEATARMMLTALLAAGCWISLATWLDAPVSTTHSVVGAIAGAGLASFGPGAVNWPELGLIAIGWVISPLLSGALAALLLAALRNRVTEREDRVAAGRVWLPIMVAATTGLLASLAAVAWHGLALSTVLALGLAGAGGGWLYARLRIRREIAADRGERLALKKLLGVPLVTAAAVMGFAHGSNDTSNVAAPLGIILDSLPTQGGLLPQGRLVLLLGGIGIALGVLLFGRRLVYMVGSKITRLNAARALCISLATSATVLGFSAAGLPVSTTHIAVGGVFGIGFYREWRDRRLAGALPALPDEERRRRHLVRRSYMRMILGAWLITVPAAALLAAVMVWIGRLL